MRSRLISETERKLYMILVILHMNENIFIFAFPLWLSNKNNIKNHPQWFNILIFLYIAQH